MTPVTLVWFRQDLRLDDNPALAAAAARGAVVPVFVWAPDEEAPWEPGAASRWWLHQSLEKLSAALEKAGAPLVIRRGPTLAALESLVKETGATHVAWNRRYEPAVIARDTAIKKKLAAAGLVVISGLARGVEVDRNLLGQLLPPRDRAPPDGAMRGREGSDSDAKPGMRGGSLHANVRLGQ
jgi:deoxyribodipyrimidine photolyase